MPSVKRSRLLTSAESKPWQFFTSDIDHRLSVRLKLTTVRRQVSTRDRAKEALTELFNEAKGKNTHIIVERIVTDIDDIVKKVRFPDWQHTTQGERLVQKELRRTLLKYKLHTDQELFDKAYAYIRQYY